MRHRVADVVVLAVDRGEALRQGDVGTVVHVYEPEGLEVEFVRASGRTHALVTLRDHEVRAAGEGDLLAARQL